MSAEDAPFYLPSAIKHQTISHQPSDLSHRTGANPSQLLRSFGGSVRVAEIHVWILKNPRVDLPKSTCRFCRVNVSILPSPRERPRDVPVWGWTPIITYISRLTCAVCQTAHLHGYPMTHDVFVLRMNVVGLTRVFNGYEC